MKEDQTTEFLDPQLPTPLLLSFTPKGFISRTDLKFPTDLPSNNEPSIDYWPLDQESMDLSKGRFLELRKSGMYSLLQCSNNLLELDLSSNGLVFFPIELVHLSLLRTLRLDSNEIRLISSEIDRLQKLEFFSISNNQLSQLPPSFSKLKVLKVLNIGKNLIRDLSPISACKSLETLYIYGNLFTELPTSFQGLLSLKELALEWFKYSEPGMSPILKNSLNAKCFERFFLMLTSKRDKTVDFFEFVRFFSTEKLDFLQKDAKGRTFLHNAALCEELGVIFALYNRFPRLLDILDKDGQTPLTLALLEERYRSAEYLIDLGADCSVGGGLFGSALHLAVSKLHLKLVEKLLAAKGVAKGVAMDFDKNSPFHILFSIFAKDPVVAEKIVGKLLNSGMDPNLKNKELYTPLHIAVKKNQIQAIRFSLEYNKAALKEQNSMKKASDFKKKFKEEQSPEKVSLMQKPKKSKETPIKLLKTQSIDDEFTQETTPIGFNFQKRGGNAKWSLVHLASFLGHIELLHLMDEANLNFFQENSNHQDSLKVSYQSIVVIKTIRKAQKHWISRNIINSRQKDTVIETINDSEEIIARNMKKKQQVMKSAQFLARGIRKSRRIIEEMAEEISDMEEYHCEENVTQKMLNKSSDIANISDREQSARKSKKRVEKEKEMVFCFQKGDIGFFDGENTCENEVERVYKLIKGEDSGIVDKMQGFMYLKMISEKIVGILIKFGSIRLPVNVFRLNEARINKKTAENLVKWIEKLIFDEFLNEITKYFKINPDSTNNGEKSPHKWVLKGMISAEELKLFRKKNEKNYKAVNLMLEMINDLKEIDEFLVFFNENANYLHFPSIILYELVEKIFKRGVKKHGKRTYHTVTKSMNNVSVIINNNFFFTNAKSEKKKKQSVSFWGISPERLENKENFSSKPYFLV